MYNRFAAARRRYLREHKVGIHTGMPLIETLEPHFKEIVASVQSWSKWIISKTLNKLNHQVTLQFPENVL